MRRNAFTLVELLVVVAIIALLLGILLPSLSQARQAAQASVCASNIRQLFIANTGYAVESNDFYVLASEDIFVGNGGYKRWHGVRNSPGVSANPADNHFDPARGPLVAYLGTDGKVKACPTFADYIKAGTRNAFEEGTGGYGYNAQYIGGRRDLYGPGPLAPRNSAKSIDAVSPATTAMFTDAAVAQNDGAPYLTEYSFCEPPHWELGGGRLSAMHPSPSIHFRHLERTTVMWTDGHADVERLTASGPSTYGVTEAQARELHLGWFGPDDNSLFDLN